MKLRFDPVKLRLVFVLLEMTGPEVTERLIHSLRSTIFSFKSRPQA